MEPQRAIYEPLNALRGMAALAVMLSHSAQLTGQSLVPRGYLAVDLFFCLSGFVIAHAYDQRLATGLRPVTFLKLRVIRLYPLYLLGLGIGGAVAIAAILLAPPASLTVGEWLAAAGFGLVFLPVWFATALYPLNVPSWSLLFELVVNAAFAALHPRLAISVLFLVALASFGALWWLSPPELSGGSTPATAHIGLLRATFSFSVGVLLHRLALPKHTLPGALPLLLAALAPMLLSIGPDLLIVAILFPLIIAALATCRPSRLDRCFAWLGGMSYALYALHAPILEVGAALQRRDLPLPSWLWFAVAVAAAHVAYRYYDVPVRRTRMLIPEHRMGRP